MLLFETYIYVRVSHGCRILTLSNYPQRIYHPPHPPRVYNKKKNRKRKSKRVTTRLIFCRKTPNSRAELARRSARVVRPPRGASSNGVIARDPWRFAAEQRADRQTDKQTKQRGRHVFPTRLCTGHVSTP